MKTERFRACRSPKPAFPPPTRPNICSSFANIGATNSRSISRTGRAWSGFRARSQRSTRGEDALLVTIEGENDRRGRAPERRGRLVISTASRSAKRRCGSIGRAGERDGRAKERHDNERRRNARHPGAAQGPLPRRPEGGTGDAESQRRARFRRHRLQGRDRTRARRRGASSGDRRKRRRALLRRHAARGACRLRRRDAESGRDLDGRRLCARAK